MTFDPRDLGAPGPTPTFVVRGSETTAGATTEDIAFSADRVAETDAYLVRPARAGTRPAPGIVWFHWLETGAATSNRTEFLEEARGLASRGVVSVLVQGTFPWLDRPVSLAHDMASVEADVRMLRAALDLLAARADVDPDRVAIVGHDFGGMYAGVLFGSDPRPSALVMMAPTARWADWFLRYWAIVDPGPVYVAGMAPLDPVTWLPSAAGRPVLLQFAGHDQYVPADVAAEISRAAGAAATTTTYDTGHELDAAARADRDAWLVAQLGEP
jgi:predicted esterase